MARERTEVILKRVCDRKKVDPLDAMAWLIDHLSWIHSAQFANQQMNHQVNILNELVQNMQHARTDELPVSLAAAIEMMAKNRFRQETEFAKNTRAEGNDERHETRAKQSDHGALMAEVWCLTMREAMLPVEQMGLEAAMHIEEQTKNAKPIKEVAIPSPVTGGPGKFAELDHAITVAMTTGPAILFVDRPEDLGDTHEEMVMNLDKIGETGLHMRIQPKKWRKKKG